MNQRRPEISLISPVYMGEKSIRELVELATIELEQLTDDFEIILVEDASPDNSWAEIRKLCDADPRVKGIRLSRNFGQHYALTAGLEASSGNYVIVIDCDLQDDPVYIADLYRLALEGNEIVYTLKDRRAHQGFKRVIGQLYHRTLSSLVVGDRQKSPSNVGNYSLITRHVVQSFLQCKEYHRSYLAILRWLGFKSTYLTIDHRERPYGKSSYSIGKLFQLAIDGIISQTDRILYLSIFFGLFFITASLLGALYIVVTYFISGFQEGWASIAVLILSSTGITLMSLSVTAIYAGKILEQTKGRPLYLVSEKLNMHSQTADTRDTPDYTRQAASENRVSH